jgi:hypothetical protein
MGDAGDLKWRWAVVSAHVFEFGRRLEARRRKGRRRRSSRGRLAGHGRGSRRRRWSLGGGEGRATTFLNFLQKSDRA